MTTHRDEGKLSSEIEFKPYPAYGGMVVATTDFTLEIHYGLPQPHHTIRYKRDGYLAHLSDPCWCKEEP